mgnify:CR=1 FL=1
MSVPDLFKNYILLQCVKEKLIQVRALKNQVQIQVKKKPEPELVQNPESDSCKSKLFPDVTYLKKKILIRDRTC